ncbi:unnamed protein product [Clonostachys rosea]|uniref:F-box domain-containing protein n=1 Tax=Bionectria ochroleuca TaxID=29856 RepID=A0ABY6TUM4_BIOOC|nr:unnamed protein product [Clonostachys rosea]
MDRTTGRVLPGCTICGLRIRKLPNQQDRVWLSKYRVLYLPKAKEPQVSGNIKISGIGSYQRIPSYDSIYVTTAYTNQMVFPFAPHKKDDYEIVKLVNPEAYIFHDSCWALLERSHAPLPVPLKDLYDTCRSTDFDSKNKIINWGHDYLRCLRTPNPQNEGHNDLRSDTGSPFESQSSMNASELSDPLGSVEVDPWLVGDDLVRKFASSRGNYNTICTSLLGRLPSELQYKIVDCLPVQDVFSLGLGCRAFLPILYYEPFYKNQFSLGGERAWFFEADEIRQAKGLTWSQLFRLTSRRYLLYQRTMLNRSRVWKLIQFLKEKVLKEKSVNFNRQT